MAENQTLLSVRGEAKRIVEPDAATIDGAVRAVAGTQAEATSTVRDRLESVRAALSALGGQALTPEGTRAPLAWSARSMRTGEEHDHDKHSGMYGPTGRYRASVDVRVVVRDFDLLPSLTDLVGTSGDLHVIDLTWSVDDDNPSWPLVRADAIRAALRQGQDYAAALGGEVLRVEHVADQGLLGGDGRGGRSWAAQAMDLHSGSAGRGGEGIVLDPVPQVLSAVVEARFTATVGLALG